MICSFYFTSCFHLNPWILVVFFFFFLILLLALWCCQFSQTVLIKYVSMADACAPDLKKNSMNQKGRAGFWKKQKMLALQGSFSVLLVSRKTGCIERGEVERDRWKSVLVWLKEPAENNSSNLAGMRDLSAGGAGKGEVAKCVTQWHVQHLTLLWSWWSLQTENLSRIAISSVSLTAALGPNQPAVLSALSSWMCTGILAAPAFSHMLGCMSGEGSSPCLFHKAIMELKLLVISKQCKQLDQLI